MCGGAIDGYCEDRAAARFLIVETPRNARQSAVLRWRWRWLRHWRSGTHGPDTWNVRVLRKVCSWKLPWPRRTRLGRWRWWRRIWHWRCRTLRSDAWNRGVGRNVYSWKPPWALRRRLEWWLRRRSWLFLTHFVALPACDTHSVVEKMPALRTPLVASV